MARQVDLKALVSHIVRADGINKCRVCMGDTSEGQVYLTDTVMMDGDKPIILSELLETITKTKVAEETELPAGLCCDCSNSAITTWQFQKLYLESEKLWRKSISMLANTDKVDPKNRTLFIGHDLLLHDKVASHSVTDAIERLNILLQYKQKTQTKLKKISKKSGFYYCKDCGKEFPLPYHLNRHLINTSRRACTLCGKIVSKAMLAKHLKIHNKVVKSCNLCYKLFDDRAKWDQHVTSFHGIHSLQCTVCKKGFKSERSVRAHMYTHTLFNCSSCNMSFENRKCFIYHRKICNGSKCSTSGIYECHDCGNVYTQKPSLKVHIVQKHLKISQCVCHVCGKKFSNIYQLNTHQVVHKTERKTYQCDCGAKFTTKLGFQLHQMIHTGEKPFKCDVCGDRFLSSSRRLDHIKRRHRSKELAHGCDQCAARFIRPFELKNHYYSAHVNKNQ